MDWHEAGLRSLHDSKMAYERQLARVQYDVARLGNMIDHLALQIEEAKRRGLKSFDPDKFMHQRKKAV
jgi:hypothetical protein